MCPKIIAVIPKEISLPLQRLRWGQRITLSNIYYLRDCSQTTCQECMCFSATFSCSSGKEEISGIFYVLSAWRTTSWSLHCLLSPKTTVRYHLEKSWTFQDVCQPWGCPWAPPKATLFERTGMLQKLLGLGHKVLF